MSEKVKALIPGVRLSPKGIGWSKESPRGTCVFVFFSHEEIKFGQKELDWYV